MKKITIEIEETPYQVLVADTDETRERGLMGITHMPKNKGMLFKWDKPGKREFWMKNTVLPLLQAFLNEDMEVVKVLKRQPLDETLMGFDDIQYVLELNADEDVKEGDEMTIEDNNQKVPVMKIIGSDGNVQGIIQGGERIVSRRETVILIKKAKKITFFSFFFKNPLENNTKYVIMIKMIFGGKLNEQKRINQSNC